MRYVSIDLETTGLNPKNCQILEFGAVVEDTNEPWCKIENLPTFSRVLLLDQIRGEPYALNMNRDLIKMIAERPNGIAYANPQDLGEQFKTWLSSLGFEQDDQGRVKFLPAGKNYATFDKLFLEGLPGWSENCQPSHRTLDPCTLYINPQTDTKPPSLGECLQRAGFESVVNHRAIDDARMVVQLFRHKWGQ